MKFVLCCGQLLRVSHPGRHDYAWVDGRGKERARLDDQNTLKDDHNKVTCTPLLGGLLSHVRVSHGRRWERGGCILGGSYTGFTSCTGATGTRHCPWAPPGPPWGLTWSPVTAGGYTPRGAGGKVPTIVDLLQRISLSGSLLVRNSRVTSNEKRSWNYCLWQMAKLHTTGTIWEVPSTYAHVVKGVYCYKKQAIYLSLNVVWLASQINIWGTKHLFLWDLGSGLKRSNNKNSTRYSKRGLKD